MATPRRRGFNDSNEAWQGKSLVTINGWIIVIMMCKRLRVHTNGRQVWCPVAGGLASHLDWTQLTRRNQTSVYHQTNKQTNRSNKQIEQTPGGIKPNPQICPIKHQGMTSCHQVQAVEDKKSNLRVPQYWHTDFNIGQTVPKTGHPDPNQPITIIIHLERKSCVWGRRLLAFSTHHRLHPNFDAETKYLVSDISIVSQVILILWLPPDISMLHVWYMGDTMSLDLLSHDLLACHHVTMIIWTNPLHPDGLSDSWQ